MSQPQTPLLDRIHTPADLRALPASDLRQLADELRAETVSAVSVTGGHLGAGFGVVELTVALHYVFDTPRDRLVWDVGHQAYPHKILTGRRDRIRTLRQGGGLSGFTKRAESEYDPFGAAHSSTSISAALGMAVARDLAHRDNDVVAVIGDGAMSAGMAYEAMNNAGGLALAPDRHPQRQRHVDRAADRRDVGLSRPARLQPHLHVAARRRQAAGEAAAALLLRQGQADRGIRPRLLHRRHLVRGARLLLCRADRRPQSRPPVAGAEERARHAARPGAGARRHQEGQGLSAGRGRRRQVSWRQRLRRRHRRPGEAEEQRAELHQRVRRRARRRRGARREDRRRHRRDAARDRRRPLRRRLSRPRLRRRHRRAARRHFRRRPRRRGLQAVLRDLFDLPPARLRPGRARRRGAEPAGALRHRPRRAGRRRRPDPRRRLRPRLSRLPAQHDGDGGGRRGRARPHGRDLRRPRRRPDRVALSARRRRRRRTAGARRSRCRSARAASCARARASPSCRSARGSPRR